MLFLHCPCAQIIRCHICSHPYPTDTADEARSLKAYGELPESAKINETDTYGPNEDGECNFEFDEDRDSSDEEGGKEIEIDDI